MVSQFIVRFKGSIPDPRYGTSIPLPSETPSAEIARNPDTFLDSRVPAAWPGQYLLGAVTLAVLWLCTRTLDAADRGLVWMCVVVATGFEILGSLVWGAYRYRFGGIPLFVPFGHGLIYVFGARLAATSWVRRHEELFTRGILVVATVWAIAGLTVLPSWTARHDVHGLVWLPVFAYVLLRSPRKAFFAALFIATTDIELVGTWCCNWIWAPTTPWLHVASGNPPSAIAGGYAIIDGSMLRLAALISRLREVQSRWPFHEKTAVAAGIRPSSASQPHLVLSRY
jgi:hypothetical protein